MSTNSNNLINSRRMPKGMYRQASGNTSPGTSMIGAIRLSYRLLFQKISQMLWRQAQGMPVNIQENRLSTCIPDGIARRYITKRRRNDQISGLYACNEQGYVQSAGTIDNRRGVPCACQAADTLFQDFYIRTYRRNGARIQTIFYNIVLMVSHVGLMQRNSCLRTLRILTYPADKCFKHDQRYKN